MTREKAKKHYMKIKNSALDEIALNVIDDIYDEFESRTCENCEYYRVDILFSKKWDCTKNIPSQKVVNFPPKDFGCNSFKRFQDV